MSGIAGIINTGLTRFRVHVGDAEGAFVWTGFEPLEDELLTTRKVQEGQVLSRRANEDQIIVAGVVERKKAAALYSDGLVQLIENVIQVVNRQHLANPRVVVEDEFTGIALRVQIAHAGFRAADKCSIAKDYPRRIRSSRELAPESTQRSGNCGRALLPGGAGRTQFHEENSAAQQGRDQQQ